MLTHQMLLAIMHYEPNTGIFHKADNSEWVSKPSGKPIGFYHPKGYLVVHINRKHYRAHRLAWFYMTGKWPVNQVDHINNVKDDNRWCNLREATNQENHFNLNKPKNNTSGAKGVRQVKSGKWQARIKFNQKEEHLGTYDTLEDASNAYLKRATELADIFANRGH